MPEGVGTMFRLKTVVGGTASAGQVWLQDTLFADTAVYDYQAREQLAITAWYVAKDFADTFAVGAAAARKLSERFPDDEQRRANMDWYERLRSALH